MIATRRQQLFETIAAAPGGATGQLLSPERLARAQAAIDAMAPLARAELETVIGRIIACAEARADADFIFRCAHDVRGMAGSFGLTALGIVAGELRAYGQNREPDFEPDWVIVKSLALMLGRALRFPRELPDTVIAAECRKVVIEALKREGRSTDVD